MFPVPVGNTTAASQHYGRYSQGVENRRYEDENAEEIASRQAHIDRAAAHEDVVEDEIAELEDYERTLSRSHRSGSQRAQSAYPSMQHVFDPLKAPTDETTKADGTGGENESKYNTSDGRGSNGAGAVKVHVQPQPSNADIAAFEQTLTSQNRQAHIAAFLARRNSGSHFNEETLHLANIQDAEIKGALDPANTKFTARDLESWDEERLQRLVNTIEPQHLPVLMQRRMQVSQSERAKNLSFHHVKYEMNGVTYLNDVSGYIETGMLVGVLGAPDSGITPLLNILAGRQHGGTMTGDVLYDGKKRNASFTRYVGYVVKEDPHLAHLTVFETLFFSARLRLPALPIKIVKYRVALTLKLLGLSHVGNSVVGDGSLRGISGGEKRRVSFGIEMVAGHACILADLPTNGLDSSSAYSLMKTMRFATKAGFSMMASVVQPAPQLLRLFHRIMVMSKGTCIYYGPVGQAEDHFLSVGFVRPTTKALPQFLEELSLKPELFYRPKLAKRIADAAEEKLQDDVKLRTQPQQRNEQHSAEEGRRDDSHQPTQQQRDDKHQAPSQDEQKSPPVAPAPPHPSSSAPVEDTNGSRPSRSDDEEKSRVATESGRGASSTASASSDSDAPKSSPPPSGDDAVTEPVPPAKSELAGDVAKEATTTAPPEPLDPKIAPPVLTEPMGLIVKQGDTDTFVKAKENAPTSNGDSSASPSALKGKGIDELPEGVNKQRFAAWELAVQHYKKSTFYQDVLEVLKAQKERKQLTAEQNGELASPSANSSLVNKYDDCDIGWYESVSRGQFWYRHFNSSPWLQVQMNLYRQTILTYRNTGLWRDTWLLSIVMGFFLGSLFYMEGTDYRQIQNRVGLFFFILSYLAFNAVMLVPVLAHQREVYYNQLAGGYYHGFTYYIGHFITQIPLVVVETLLLLLPVWGLGGLTGGDAQSNFWYAYLIIAFNSLISRVWMIFLAASSPNEVYADVLNTVTNIIWTKLCGYFVIKTNIVGGWYWVYVTSYFSYALRGLAKNDIGPLENLCGPNNAVVVTPDNACLFYNGQTALTYLYGINDLDKWADFVDLVWFMIAFNFGAMMAVTYINWQTHDDAEHPDFGEVLDQKHRDAHSDIMQSKDHKQITDGNEQNKQNGADQQKTSAAAEGHTQSDENGSADEANSAGAGASARSPKGSEAITYQHSVKSLPPDTAQTQANSKKSKKTYLQWKDLEYEVQVGKEGGGTEARKLLKKVFGYAKPGEMTALMGASGAGKSTLLDVLAGKKTGGKITGDIILNGRPVDFGGSFSRIAGYVEQFDSHNAFSTVREAVEFSGRLRLPRVTTTEELSEKVDHVLQVLGIKHLSNSIIGAPGFGGVSQEVRKKVTIAVELIMEPSLLFLDEPTTGLDSAGAYAVLSAMKLLANGGGITVVCTIHQPSAELALMFDQMLLMKPGGQVAYFGKFKELPDWFKENNLGELQSGQNPADFALEQVKQASAGKDVKGNKVDLAELYATSPLGKSSLDEINKGIMPEEENKAYVEPKLADSQPALYTQLRVMTIRFFLSFVRNTSFIGIRFFLAIFMGFVVGTVFIQLGNDQQYSDQRISAIFVVLIFVMFTANAFIPDIFFLRPIYFREQGSRMYHPIAFYVGRFISDIPFVVGEVLVLCIMVYFICNLNSSNHSQAFGLFFFTMLGVRWTSIFFTWAVGTAIESPNNANTIQSTYFNLMMILTGFILPGPNVPGWWVWFYDLAFLKYALHFLIANETRSEQYYCDSREIIPFSPNGAVPGDTYCSNVLDFTSGQTPESGQYCFGVCTLTDQGTVATVAGRSWAFDTGCGDNCGKCRLSCGYDTMQVYGVEWEIGQMATNQVVLWCFGIFFFICGYFALRYINHIKR